MPMGMSMGHDDDWHSHGHAHGHADERSRIWRPKAAQTNNTHYSLICFWVKHKCSSGVRFRSLFGHLFCGVLWDPDGAPRIPKGHQRRPKAADTSNVVYQIPRKEYLPPPSYISVGRNGYLPPSFLHFQRKDVVFTRSFPHFGRKGKTN